MTKRAIKKGLCELTKRQREMLKILCVKAGGVRKVAEVAGLTRQNLNQSLNGDYAIDLKKVLAALEELGLEKKIKIWNKEYQQFKQMIKE